MSKRDEPAGSEIGVVVDASCDVPSAERSGRWVVIPECWRGPTGPMGAGPDGGAPVIELQDQGEHSRELVQLTLAESSLEPAEIPAATFAAAYDQFSDLPRVYSVHSAASMSPAVQLARAAARQYANVRVVETPAAGIATGLLAVRLQSLAAEGHPPEAIDAYIERASASLRLLIVPDKLDPNGRQRLSTALLLAGRPLMSAEGGAVSPGRRLRSREATVSAIRRYIETHAPSDRTLRVAVGHGDAAGAVDPLLDILDRTRPDATIELVGRVGPRLVTHVGARCVALAWLAE